MADEEDVGESWEPEVIPDIPVSEQEKLKLELMKLNEQANVSLAPKGVDPAKVEALKDVMKGSPMSLQNPLKPASPAEKPVEAQAPPEPEDAPITMSPDTPKFNQPSYEPTKEPNIRMLSTEKVPGKTFSPEVERSLDIIAKMYPQFPREMLAGFVQVESGGQAKANIDRATQYKGLLQIGREEWRKHGGGGDIYDAEQNLKGGASLMETNRQDFIRNFKREPTPAELYLIHQQGLGFFTKGKMTNIAGNLPPNARTPENMTWEGFKNWWTKRIERAIAERGASASMSKVEDSNLPAGFLYPGGFADVGGEPLTKGGLNETPAQQAMIASLMHGGKPLAQQAGVARAQGERAAAAAANPRLRRQVSAKVPLTKEAIQARGVLPEDPSSVSHTTMPIPGIVTPGQQAVMDVANPSTFSTIMNYQAEQLANAPPPPPQAEMRATPQGFVARVLDAIKGIAPQGMEAGNAQRNELIKELVNKPEEVQPNFVVDLLKKISDFDQKLTKGVVGGIASQPGQIYSGVVGPTAVAAGQLAGSPGITKFGVETSMSGPEDAQAWVKGYGGDMNDPITSGAFKLGENLGPNLAKTLINLGMSKVGEEYLGPAAESLGKNYPIPNLNPISPAHAASAFGKPPLVVNTPAGPVVMNDADVSSFAYGGALAVGFGSSPALIAKGVRSFRTFKPIGLDGVFDPRRPIPGVTHTEAASIPGDILKSGIIDQGKGLIDIAERQAKYEKGTSVGIDPIASNEVLQAWRVQTNSGAQNLITSALENGEMNVPDYRFKVQTPIKKLVEFAKQEPQFPEYLRLRAIQDELRYNAVQNQGLPTGSNRLLPSYYRDPNNLHVMFDTNGVAQALNNIENDFPMFRRMYTHYEDNLIATRDLVTSHANNSYENAATLSTKAIDHPTLPIFHGKASPKNLFEAILRGDDPLQVAEHNMRKAFDKQLKTDAEMRYIKMTEDNVGAKAFTSVTPEWVESSAASGAKKAGAILHRRVLGEDRYWTADPLVISIMNSGHVPLSTMESHFATAKSVFQKTTTGAFAPWFAPTGMIRSMEQGWTTAPGGMKDAKGRTVLPAGPWSTAMGMATRAGAQMARPTAAFFRDTLAQTAWGKMLTFGQADLMARNFEKWYMDSAYKQLNVSGAFSGDSVMEGKQVYKSIASARQTYGGNPTMNPVINYMERVMGHIKAFTYDPLKKGVYTPLNEALTIIQEGPAYGYARKVLRGSDDTHRPTQHGRVLSDAEVAEMAFKNYTGNPATRGYIFQKGGAPLRFEPGTGLPNRNLNPVQRGAQHVLRATWGAQTKAATELGRTAHYMRSVTPWAGVLFQSPSATLAAMRDNPVRANLMFSASHVMPELVAYLWNSYYSQQMYDAVDDNGEPVIGSDGKPLKVKYDYVNHMMNMRNDHNLLNNTYFAVPGKRPNHGVEFRHYQEGAFNRYMTRAVAHQYFGKSYGTMGDDAYKALQGFLGTAIIPPMPSPLGVFLGNKGMVSTGGWAGSLFKSRNNPYVDLGGGESPTELIFRAIAPSIADITIQAQMAGTNAPDWASVPTAVAKQVGKRIIGRTAIVGDAFGVKPDVTGSTVLSEELWGNKKTIDDLLYRYRVWDEGSGVVKTNKGSKTGRAYVAEYMGDIPPLDGKDMISNPGLPQKDPKNPLYKILMEELEQTFAKDEPKKGGVGYKSMWGQYGVFGQLVSRMRTVNEGNAGVWAKEQLDKPELMQWLRDKHVNPLNFKEVRDYYQTRRNSATQKILQTIKATEQRMSEYPQVKSYLKGKPFKVGMLDPDEPGLQADRGEEQALQDIQ